MTLSPLLSYTLTLAGQFKYPLVAGVTVIEGPILMMLAGFLLHEHFFTLVPLFCALLIGDLLADIAWYYIGYFFAERLLRKHGHLLSITPELFEKAKALFHKYHIKILFISKITIGFGMAIGTLVTAGAMRIPLRKYMAVNFLGELVLVSALLSAGYFFGGLVSSLVGSLKIVFTIGLLVIGAGVLYGFSRFMKKKITSSL